MLAQDLISDVVPFLRTSDTGTKALTWMEIFRISHLPIIKQDEFVGLISDNDIYDLNIVEEQVGNYNLSLFRPYIKSNQHIYEVLNIAAQQKLTVVPVLDLKNKYLGVITLHDLLYHFAEVSAVKHLGGIIELEIPSHNYSLSQIAQIVESNGVKILSSYITDSQESMHINVTLKLNSADLSSVIRTFERYDYTIKSSFMKEDLMESAEQDRLDLLLKYLNI